MAGASMTTVILNKTVFGNKRMNFGYSTTILGETTGEIATELYRVETFIATPASPAIIAHPVTIDTDFPCVGGVISVIYALPKFGNYNVYWLAIGY